MNNGDVQFSLAGCGTNSSDVNEFVLFVALTINVAFRLAIVHRVFKL